jgi:hypothetical protein
MRMGFSVLAVFLALATPLCALGPVATANPSSDVAAGLQATFVRSDGGPARIEQAVERAVAQANILVRSIARSRLLHDNRAFEQVRFELDGDRIMAKLGEAPPIVSPADGSAAMYKVPGGDRARVRQQVRGRTLVQHFRGRDGERTNRFVLSADGRHLDYQVEVKSKYLPEPLRYALRFRRSP